MTWLFSKFPLIVWYPPIILVELSLFSIVLFSCRGVISGIFQAVPRRTWAAVALIALLGGALRMNGLHMYETYYDGYEYAVAARSIARTGAFHTCSARVDGECLSRWLPTHPPASHVLYALAMRLVGTTARGFFDSTVAVGTATVALIFIAAFALSRDPAAALWAALLLALAPLHIKLSSAGMLEIGGLFYALLALFSLSLLREKPGLRTLLLVILSTALAAQSRAEAFLFLFLSAGAVCLYGRELSRRWPAPEGTGRGIALALLLAALALPAIYYVTHVTTSYNGFGVERNIKGFSWRHLAENLWPNTLFYFDNHFHPVLYSLAALAGAAFILRSPLALEHAFLFGWFLSFSLLFLFYGPNFGNYGHDESQHFALSTYPPLILSAAVGISRTVAALGRYKVLAGVVLAGLVLSNAYVFDRRYIRAYGPAAPRLILEHLFVSSLKDRLPADSFIVTVNPNIVFADTDFSGSELRSFERDREALSRLAPPSRFQYYFLENSWCAALAEQGDASCGDFKRRHDLELVARSEDGGAALYRMRSVKAGG
jgi:4-amino-4-deoxy-L-arabinose transferase-like glycosyltransferase